ncbi:hypothetical protein GCM10007907_13750 [Chitinimonas prasina]|uniref:Uncharacterized protein n=1 Tax=Chitinimonas prasina TaxID=1434937 RepID=A0ABQ5YCC4_9NEIS|nr:hypothetical protein GCM10007907_13750 [Chitinimonas prasina]
MQVEAVAGEASEVYQGELAGLEKAGFHGGCLVADKGWRHYAAMKGKAR